MSVCVCCPWSACSCSLRTLTLPLCSGTMGNPVLGVHAVGHPEPVAVVVSIQLVCKLGSALRSPVGAGCNHASSSTGSRHKHTVTHTTRMGLFQQCMHQHSHQTGPGGPKLAGTVVSVQGAPPGPCAGACFCRADSARNSRDSTLRLAGTHLFMKLQLHVPTPQAADVPLSLTLRRAHSYCARTTHTATPTHPPARCSRAL